MKTRLFIAQPFSAHFCALTAQKRTDLGET